MRTIKEWELDTGVVVFIGLLSYAATAVLMAKAFTLMNVELENFINTKTVYEYSSNFFSTIVIWVLALFLSNVLLTRPEYRWPYTAVILYYAFSYTLVAAAVIVFISDMMIFSGRYLLRFQIRYLLRQKNIVRTTDDFLKLGESINNGLIRVAEVYKNKKQELSYAAVEGMRHYIYHSFEYIRVGSTDNEGVLHSEAFLKNAEQYIELKDKELYESIKVYVKTFDIEYFFQYLNSHYNTNFTIFSDSNR